MNNLRVNPFYIYSVKDNLVGDFGSTLYTFCNDEVAKRWFSQIISSTCPVKDRGDLELWKLGLYDTVSGSIDITDTINPYKERILIGSEVE